MGMLGAQNTLESADNFAVVWSDFRDSAHYDVYTKVLRFEMVPEEDEDGKGDGEGGSNGVGGIVFGVGVGLLLIVLTGFGLHYWWRRKGEARERRRLMGLMEWMMCSSHSDKIL